MNDERIRSCLWAYNERLVIVTNTTVINNSENDSNSVNAAEKNFNDF